MKRYLPLILLPISISAFALTDQAEVLSVDTVMKTQVERTPYEHCYTEEVPVYSDRHRPSNTPEIVGGILGGVIGNQFGRGRAKPVTTAAGTLLGASLAHDANRPKVREVVGYRQVQRCETRYKQVQEQHLDYYLVTAIYNNQEFSFKTNTKPGDVVKVNISPVYK